MRRKFKRKSPEKPYLKLFVIATEGEVTEPSYFNTLFKKSQAKVKVQILKSKTQSAPAKVLKRLEGFLADHDIRKTDEAWLVVDRDQWSPQDLQQLCEWTDKATNRCLALSNPCFELWLLLHFEDGRAATDLKEIKKRLAKHLPHFEKEISVNTFNFSMAREAVERAKASDKPPCKTWPEKPACTTVYRLVEKLLKVADQR